MTSKIMALVSTLVLTLASQSGFAANETFSINIEPINDGLVVFYGCENEDCEVIGDEQGYSLESFKAKPKLQKTFAIALGVGEAAVTVVAVGYAVTSVIVSAGVISATGVVSSSYKALFGAIAVAGATPTSAHKVDGLNPAHYWRTSNINRAILDLKEDPDAELIEIKFDKFKKYEKHLNALNKSLKQF